MCGADYPELKKWKVRNHVPLLIHGLGLDTYSQATFVINLTLNARGRICMLYGTFSYSQANFHYHSGQDTEVVTEDKFFDFRIAAY